MVSFSHVIFYVRDISIALAFYQKAFKIETKFVHESGDYAELATGTTSIAFASAHLGAMNLPHGYIHHDLSEKPLANELVLTVDDVLQAYTHAISEGAVALVEPKQKSWGQIVGYVRDPNGVLVELASKM